MFPHSRRLFSIFVELDRHCRECGRVLLANSMNILLPLKRVEQFSNGVEVSYPRIIGRVNFRIYVSPPGA